MIKRATKCEQRHSVVMFSLMMNVTFPATPR